MKKNFSFHFDILTLLVLIAGIVLSRFLMNFGLGMLVFRLFFVGSWKEKFENIKSQKAILITILSFFLLHLLGLLWTDNIRFGLDEIVRKIAFLIIPITILAISPLKKQTLKYLFWGFLMAIFVGTIWGSIVYFSNPYADPRNLILSTSHIRFSLNITLAILILVKITVVDRKRIKPIFRILSYVLSLWFLFYLFLTQALTGIVILSIFLFFYIPYYSIKNKRRKSTILIFTIYISTILVTLLWVNKEYNFYFTPNKIYENKLVEKTPDGGTYLHMLENKHLENGNYVYLYYCQDEISEHWKKRTGLEPMQYMDAIVRYMNSISPYKDGKRFRELTDNDIENIKNQISNKVYTKELSLKPRLYSIFLQINTYQVNGSVKGASEMQRLELWKNALSLIQDNFFIGSGTGDIVDDFASKLSERKSQLSDSSLKAHNQYLYIFASFGVLGFLLFLIFLFYPPIKLGLFSSYIYFVFFFIIAISMLTEDTLDNLAGIMFFIFINSILLFNSKTIKDFIPKRSLR
ncbi:MAG: O-antigen ligase family protein [Bacteroidales bacterium]|nr:O-antigen ligase family protein [Bacteroidales bacterium]